MPSRACEFQTFPRCCADDFCASSAKGVLSVSCFDADAMARIRRVQTTYQVLLRAFVPPIVKIWKRYVPQSGSSP